MDYWDYDDEDAVGGLVPIGRRANRASGRSKRLNQTPPLYRPNCVNQQTGKRKVAWSTRHEADAAIASMQASNGGVGQPVLRFGLSSYRCWECGRWHIGHRRGRGR